MLLLDTLEHSIWLDSGIDPQHGRFDILSGAPSEKAQLTSAMPLTKPLLASLTTKQCPQNLFPQKPRPQTIPERYQSVPFVCGLIGYYAYDFGAQQIVGQIDGPQDATFPLAVVAYYTWSYVFDKRTGQGYLTFSPACAEALRQRVMALIETGKTQADNEQVPKLLWHKTISYQEYCRRFELALAYINAGDCYQVNLAQRFETSFSGSPLALYFSLRERVHTPYSAFMKFTPQQHLLCFSPEQFIRIHDRQIRTRPIKGTMANRADADESATLQNSAKNRAENLMIVDLLRNDLSKVCQLHSVKVTELFKLESYRNVHHLVSSIEGELRPELTELEAFLACFPGGSITGAPKKRAIEIIAELEESGRSAYCGSLFYWNDDGQFDSNILIRTIVHSDDKLYCWGGGGIVHDSVAEDEYLESLIKVENLTGLKK